MVAIWQHWNKDNVSKKNATNTLFNNHSIINWNLCVPTFLWYGTNSGDRECVEKSVDNTTHVSNTASGKQNQKEIMTNDFI
jgi:hypothetical protein